MFFLNYGGLKSTRDEFFCCFLSYTGEENAVIGTVMMKFLPDVSDILQTPDGGCVRCEQQAIIIYVPGAVVS